MKRYIFAIFASLSLATLSHAATAPFNAYWNAIYRADMQAGANYVDADNNAISDFNIEYADVKFDRLSIAETEGGWASCPSPTMSGPLTVNSITATVSSEIYFKYGTLTVKNDYVATVSELDSPSFVDNTNKTLRFAVDTENADFLKVGGDMKLTTSRVFNTKILYRKKNNASMSVAGQLSFDFTGGQAYGYHTVNIATGHVDMKGIDFNLGGLASSKRPVAFNSSASTAPTSGTIDLNFNFKNDENGNFKGGSFEGSFTSSLSNGSVVNFSMAGSGTQSITLLTSATAGAKDKNNSNLLASQKDMSVGTVAVSNGNFILNSELSIANVNLSGGTLSLTMGDGATVGNLTATGGSWIFADTIDVETFTSSGTINVVFTEALEKEFYTLITCNGLSVDPATMFVARDKNGNQIAGNFDVAYDNGKYLLNFTAAVPEASEIAMLFGIIALGFAAYRRRK